MYIYPCNQRNLNVPKCCCLRVARIHTVHNTKPDSKLKGCQDEALPSDGRVRRTFKRVVALRNRDGVMP